MRISIRCQLLVASQHADAAVDLARKALHEGRLSTPARLVAERLLVRGYQRESPMHFADLEVSLALAIEARDAARAWDGPSHTAVAIAVQAAQALGNWQKAWALTQPPPAGEATAREANSPEIRKIAALLGAEHGAVIDAEHTLSELDDPVARSEAGALLAERRDQSEVAKSLWIQAGAGANTASEQQRIGFQIALHGQVPAQVNALSATQVRELTLIAEAASGEPGKREVLRARASRNRTLTFALVVILSRAEDYAAAATVAAEGAQLWADAGLWAIAARLFLRAEDLTRAADAARNALQVAPPSWGDRPSAYGLLIEALTAAERWVEATDAAAELLSRDPQNQSAAWALVLCQLRLGRVEDAWTTYSTFGGRPKPRNEREALARIHLWTQYEKSEAGLDDLFEVLDAFETKVVQEAVVHALLFFPETASTESSERVRSRLSHLLAVLPDRFIPQQIDEDDPRKTLDAMVADHPDTSEYDRSVADGELPFGYAASVHHRSYASLLSCRTGTVFAGDALGFEREVEAARSVRGRHTVADASALATIGLLDPSIGDQLLGFLGVVTVELSQRIDGIQAENELSRRSTMTVGRSQEGTAQIHVITDAEADQRHERSRRLKDRLVTLAAVKRSGPTNLPIDPAHAKRFVWLEAVDLALDAPGRPFWCDDAPLRALAGQLGVTAFSTQSLIEAVRREGLLLDSLAEALQAILITHHYVGLHFRQDWLAAAAELEGWLPNGGADFIRWAPPTSTPEPMIRFVIDAIERSVSSPIAIEGWVEAASHWLVRVGGDDARANLIWFMQLLLRQAWLDASRLPFVLRGVRTAVRSSELEDPFEDAIRLHYRRLSAKAGYSTAAMYLRGLVSLAEPTDRSLAIRITLTD